jgi:hypothetical protein
LIIIYPSPGSGTIALQNLLIGQIELPAGGEDGLIEFLVADKFLRE